MGAEPFSDTRFGPTPPGRSGAGRERRVLIFDPETSVLLAEEGVLLDKVDWLDGEPPLVIGYNTYLVSDIVPTMP